MIKVLFIFLLGFKTISPHYTTNIGIDYISVTEIASLAEGQISRFDNKIELFYKNNRTTIFTETKQCLVSGKKLALENVLFEDSEIYLDAETWAYILSQMDPEYTYYWDFAKKRFILSRYPSSIKEIRLKGDTLYLRYNIDLKPELEKEGDNLILIINRGFYSGLATKRSAGKAVRRIVTRHTSSGARITVELNPYVEYKVEEKPGSILLIFSVKEVAEEEYQRKIHVIVIDPGHGGKDPGAIAHGVKEKDIVLKIAKKLKKKLEKAGFKVYLTRDRDVFVPLMKRAEFANKVKCDLFISLHCNYSKGARARGIETYFLSQARTKWERAVAAFENSVIKYEIEEDQDTMDILKMILGDMAQYEFLKESQDLAFFIQESMVRRTRRIDRGVKQAGFYVLRGVYAPSVLIETAFLSNKSERKLLRDEKFLDRVAEGIKEGIVKFKVRYERGKF